MGYGYGEEVVRRRIIEVLGSSESGMSGTDLASQIGISRITLTKYLKVFEQRGLVKSRPSGNITIWYMSRGAGAYTFPEDYHKIESAYQKIVISGDAEETFSLVQNCINSGARPAKVITEAVLPALDTINHMYEEGRLGGLERALLKDTITRSLHYISMSAKLITPTKNCILLAVESEEMLRCRAMAAALQSDGWRVHLPGDISASVDVFFDLDLSKLLGRVWKGMPGVMIHVVFGGDVEALRFLAGSINSMRKNSPGDIRLAFCSKTDGKRLGADMASESLTDVLQWCETVHKSL